MRNLHPRLVALSDTIGLAVVAVVVALLLALGIGPWNVTEVGAGGGGNSNSTPADVIHPNIHQNNGAGQNANPNGANDGGGNMHGIGNNPGKSDNQPGVANLANVHGGIGCKNKNVAEPAGGCG